ncbi:MAG: cyclodeaminase/cyclohydrolase family protein [Balneolaceae bacterium]
MEKDLLKLSIEDLLDKLGAGSHKPGSGSAAAMLGLISCKMTQTVIKLSLERKKYKHIHEALEKIAKDIKRDIEPVLKDALQEDAIQFDRVIKARRERDNEKDLRKKIPLEEKAFNELKMATIIPLIIAKECIKLAKNALVVFDNGFQAARGDSAVAINSALSGATGAISIVYLNLTSYWGNEWAKTKIKEAEQLNKVVNDLQIQLSLRTKKLQDEAQKSNGPFTLDLEDYSIKRKKNGSVSFEEIEKIARWYQEKLWKKRRNIWKNSVPATYYEIIDPEILIKTFGFNFNKQPLGEYYIDGEKIEIAGLIDRNKQSISVSSEFPTEIQSFTTAHELGHLILHKNEVTLHRDRPLNGSHGQNEKKRIEVEADKFATYFLMPGREVRRLFEEIFHTKIFVLNEDTAFALGFASEDEVRSKYKTKHDLSEFLVQLRTYQGTSITSLVERFKVSVEAMAIRLEELGLIDY